MSKKTTVKIMNNNSNINNTRNARALVHIYMCVCVVTINEDGRSNGSEQRRNEIKEKKRT